MLNELHALSDVLRKEGISTKRWHREYKELPKVTAKTPCIRIWIANNNSISDIETINVELAQSLRKYGNNQGTFPAFNIAPLYRITDEDQILKIEEMEKNNYIFDLNRIKSWCSSDNWQKGLSNKVHRSLNGMSQRLLELFGDCTEPEYHLVAELVNRSVMFTNSHVHNFRTLLENCIFSKLQKQEDVKLMLSMLFHKGDKKKEPQKDVGPQLSIVLDLMDWQRYGRYPVTSVHVTEWINKMLLASEQLSISLTAENSGTDAFGMPFVNLNEPMPSVKLSGFDIILRTMFKEQPSQYRYKRIGDESFPIAKENRALAKESMQWLAETEKKNVTWQRIDKSEIVFVYPSKLPKVPPKFASIFGNSQQDDTYAEARFENISKEFIKTLRGLKTAEQPDSIQIFTIRKIDKGRSKLLFTRNCSPEMFIRAAEEWERGCLNLPQMEVGEMLIPFPLQVSRIINNVWKQDGDLAQGRSAVERMKCYQGLELLLDIMQENMVCNYLHILISNSIGIIKYIGNCAHGGWICKDNKERKKLDRLQRETQMLLPVFGLLLYKLNFRKENYMENMAYLVGQLLKISDELHALYSKVVRNGEVPPQLVGSTLFVAACETPNQAIAQLSVRMNPFITWAKQYRHRNITTKNEESWKAAWYLKLYEDVADKLKPAIEKTIRFNDFDKAQLFIGYLASFPKSESQTRVRESNKENPIGGMDNEKGN